MAEPGQAAGVTIRSADRVEAEAIAAVIRDSFATVAEEIGFDIPPLHESAADVLETFSAGDAVLVADVGGVIVGTVRGETMASGDVMVRRLAVLPANRGTGLARTLMQALEDSYPHVRRFELFTGSMAHGPLALYESLGYRLMEARRIEGFELVYLEKCR